MELKTYFSQDASGNIMPGATVTVYLANTTTLATGLQDESGSPLSNPFTADSSAKVSFYAPDGLYDITVVGNGRTVTIRAQFFAIDGASVLRSDLAATGGSALVGFQQAGSGAVATTVQDKLRESVSVKDFGAVGDGVADDTDAIQAAIDFLNPNTWSASFNYQQGGGTVYLPKGVYRITAPLKLAPFVTLEGDGRDGWTGGGTGIGLTGPSSPADGSAIYADFGTTTETCAIDTQNWSVAGGTLYPATNQTLITTGQLGGGTYTYCQNVGLRRLAVFCTNGTRVGVRLQGAALATMEDVSIIGFKVAKITNASWCVEYRNLFTLSTQVGGAFIGCNASKVSGVFDMFGWGTTSGTVITNNNAVNAVNKPSFWSANDTNYNSTSLYIVNGLALHFDNATTQHTGRSWFAENADVTFGTLYIEDLPYLSSGDTPGAFNAYNAASGNTSITINHLHSDSNGVTLFNNVTNTPITLLNLSGIQGNTLGGSVSGNTKLMLGNNVNRNGAFGDYLFNSRIVNLVPETGTWTPSLTNIGGTGVTASGVWVKRGNVYDITISITGTGLTATGGGATVISIPFGTTPGFPPPARASACAVSTPNCQAVTALMQNNANLYLGAVTSTTQIVITFQMFAE